MAIRLFARISSGFDKDCVFDAYLLCVGVETGKSLEIIPAFAGVDDYP